jgi:hypothetical protein
MKLLLLISLLALGLLLHMPEDSLQAQGLTVNYDCSELPGPWNIIGEGAYTLSINSGILTMIDHSTTEWALLEYVSPLIAGALDVRIDALVRVPSSNGIQGSPQISLLSFDPALPYTDRAHSAYAVDLYTDRIEFTRIVTTPTLVSTLLGSCSVPDLSSTFHKITLSKHEDGEASFTVMLDDNPVIVVTGESITWPLNSVDIGFGRYVGTGTSEWDYINFEATSLNIADIKDVANDQGRQVRLNFTRSALDASDSPTPVLQYEAYRWIDPLLSATSQNSASTAVKGQPLYQSALLKSWEFVGAIPAHGESDYNMIVPTLADSTADKGTYWSRFFVRAATTSPLVFFDSSVDSGYSVDNLAPNPPQSFKMNANGFLTWDPSPEKDLRYYSAYASTSPVFDQSATVLGRTSQTILDVRHSTSRYYYLTATDFAGNESKPASTELRPIAVLLSSFEAERKPNGVVIRWQVGEPQFSLVSFGVYREENSARLKLNVEALHGQESYEFTDKEAPREEAKYWLKSFSPIEQWHGPILVSNAPPLMLQLSAFPNPFNPATTITYTVPVSGEIELSLYDASGRLIRTLINHERKEAGQHQYQYQHLGSSGVYFVKLVVGEEVRTQKIVVLK